MGLVERVVASRLTNYLTTYELLDPNQAAYRKFHSCEAVLVSVCDKVFRAMDSGKVTAVLLLDLSSAFDTVNHQLLLQIVYSLGIRGSAHKWLEIYLLKEHNPSVFPVFNLSQSMLQLAASSAAMG
jgi:hypothetical protein